MPSKCLLMLIITVLPLIAFADYQIGIGRADCTGPSAEIVFMGYAKSKQKGCGIHLRQFSRAFIFDDGIRRVAFVSVDAAMMAQGVRKAVIKRLQTVYGNIYNESNLILSGTHTHGTPGGFIMDMMYDIPNFGFVRQSFDALVFGIVKSVMKAHENMVPGRIYLSSGSLMGANLNRSPQSYLKNPEEEQLKYSDNVDKEMVQLKLVNTNDTPIGVINWFAVHPTSMNNTNCLISSDNVGYASILFEKFMNKNLAGKGDFVAAFASSNLGDSSPNIKGPHCVNTNEKCDNVQSTCNGYAKFCIASGPGKDMFQSTKIIAERLFNKAKQLFQDDTQMKIVSGPLKYVHQYVDMPKENATIKLLNGTYKMVHGCLPAMGYSFAAGTTDGPGEFNFSQGTLSTNFFWNSIRDFIFPPTHDDIICHHPKPILLNTGQISLPYQWQTKIVSTQLVLIGNVLLIAVPGEFTTMSGRRLRDIVKNSIIEHGGSSNIKPIICGLSNTYTSYIATPEEYQLQRYEGASTIYGPYTLPIYMKKYSELAEVLIKGENLDPGPEPPDFSAKLISFVPPVLFDTSGYRRNFGDCILQPLPKYYKGDTVIAKFVAGHPRNNLMLGKTFLTVDKLSDNDSWIPIATDADWDTKFIWKRTSTLRGGSQAEVQWETDDNTSPGIYQIRHFGYHKYILGGVFPYKGETNTFEVE